MHVHFYSGSREYIRITQKDWEELTQGARVINNIVDGNEVNAALLQRMVEGQGEFDVLDPLSRPENVDYYVVFSVAPVEPIMTFERRNSALP